MLSTLHRATRILSGENMRQAAEAASKATAEYRTASEFLEHIKGRSSRGGQAVGGIGPQAKRQAERVKNLAAAAGEATNTARKEKLKTYGSRGLVAATPVAAITAAKRSYAEKSASPLLTSMSMRLRDLM